MTEERVVVTVWQGQSRFGPFTVVQNGALPRVTYVYDNQQEEWRKAATSEADIIVPLILA